MQPAKSNVPGVGQAVLCSISKSHSPRPVRFVWHHVQPKEAGGATTAANLVEVCDNCHYTIHRLMWYLRQQHLGQPLSPDQLVLLTRPPRRNHLMYAHQGFAACLQAGTVQQIPNEG